MPRSLSVHRASVGNAMQQDLQSPAEPAAPAAEFLDVGHADNRRRIAVRRRGGAMPGLLWLGGLKSDMSGTKAVALDRWAVAQRRHCVRFDYSGHGESEGKFTEGTISHWLDEVIAVFDTYCRGPQVVVG